MIVIDTNVLSEAMRPVPSARVIDWLAAQNPDDLFTTAITGAEMLYGIAVMPAGRRKTDLDRMAAAILNDDFGGRVLPFDFDAAAIYARLAAKPGLPRDDASVFDAMIAAIALRRGAKVATRNVRHFALYGVEIVNPFEPAL